MDNISFDRIADRYEQTRGGLERGTRFAAIIDPLLSPASEVLEIGVGTGAVARPLAALGHEMWGIDLSRAMLTRAAGRIEWLVEGDASRLPFRESAFDAAVAVWALHVVGDADALVAEVGRVVRPGGRLVVVAPRPEVASNDVTDLAYRWARQLGKDDRTQEVTEMLTAAGWQTVAVTSTPWEESEETPLARADSIERRDWSSLWEIDDDTWARVMQPIIDRLRKLPRPDQPRPLRTRHTVTSLARPDA